ncbi:MAG: tetratricopeptide repeat protein [Gammaproteobacteria bacterium]|nr:tetratricopeptide repeat protein [Gammaproteobacteria bacterium]
MTSRAGEFRARLTERRDLIARDIQELADQVDAGEIDEATAQDLRARYEQDLAEAEAQLNELPAEPSAPEEAPIETPEQGRSTKRILIGAGILVAAFTGILVLVISSAQTSPPVSNTASQSDAGATALEQMKAAVAANPDIIEMRLALADQYFEADDFSNALDQYLMVLDQNPTDGEASHTLARVGWLAYVTGQNEAAVDYIDQALKKDPTNLEATLFLGIINLYGLEDPEAAIPLLEEVLAEPNLPPQLRVNIENALEEAKGQVGS